MAKHVHLSEAVKRILESDLSNEEIEDVDEGTSSESDFDIDPDNDDQPILDESTDDEEGT